MGREKPDYWLCHLQNALLVSRICTYQDFDFLQCPCVEKVDDIPENKCEFLAKKSFL